MFQTPSRPSSTGRFCMPRRAPEVLVHGGGAGEERAESVAQPIARASDTPIEDHME